MLLYAKASPCRLCCHLDSQDRRSLHSLAKKYQVELAYGCSGEHVSRVIAASHVAKYILSLQSEEAGDLISNLKLQKLVYYCQGLHLALYDVPLFEEEVEAWTHGPVVRTVYDEYKIFGAKPIPAPTDEVELPEQEKRLIEEVYQEFGQFSAWKLRNMTHDEQPYKDAERLNLPVIAKESLRTFFKSYLTV